MKKTFLSLAPHLLLAGLIGIVFQPSSGTAATLVEENFDYATGNTNGLNGGTGWAGAWDSIGQNAQSQIVDPSVKLTYSNMGANTIGGGNAVQLVNNPATATPLVREFSGFSAGETFYMRFLMRMDSGTWDSNDFMVVFADDERGHAASSHSPAPNVGLRGALAGEDDFMARTYTDNYALSSVDFTVGTTYLVVAKFDDSDLNGEYDQASLWVNPTVGDEFTPQGISAVDDSNVTTVSYAGFRFGSNLEASDVFQFDALVITDDWDVALNVVPEPSSSTTFLAFGGLFLAMACQRVRKRAAIGTR